MIKLAEGSHRVEMAHPFSGVNTGYRSVVGDRSWNANCAWDALAILALMGDGEAYAPGADGDLAWTVDDGKVSPDGVVHLLIPASRSDIENALAGLKSAALFEGYRGNKKADIRAAVDAILAIQQFAVGESEKLLELDVNPLLLCAEGEGVFAADALIVLQEE